MTDIVAIAAAENLVIPKHIAIVMDGNGRWAKQRGLPRIAGHYEGRKATKRVVEACKDLRVGALSVYAFSTENWGRPEDEVSGLMALIEHALAEELQELTEVNVQVRASGRLEQLPVSMQKVLADSIAATAQNTGLILNLCINYGGRAELVDAARKLVAQAQAGKLEPQQVDFAQFQSVLYQPDLPDVELFLRPGREMRVSNFLLWQIAYAEMVIMDVLWPDFAEEHLLGALRVFSGRQRRFGQVVEEED
ncbi:MAG: polyprenyl diphosphate synthase [Armatimonadota bacterium]